MSLISIVCINLSDHFPRLDAGFVPWMTDLRRHLLEIFPLGDGVIPIPEEVPLQPKWILLSKKMGLSERQDTSSTNDATVERLTEEASHKQVNGENSVDQQHGMERFEVVLRKNHRVTPDLHCQDVRQLELTSSLTAGYAPGDVLTIYPRNPPEDVDTLIDLMGWNPIADLEIHLVRNNASNEHNRYPPPPLSLERQISPLTLRQLLTNNLDLNAIPKRSFFSSMVHFTDDPMQKERLLEFVKPEYIDELYDYTTRPRRSIVEVLQEFDTVKIPWQWATSVLPELRGRQFSIASGGQLKTDALGYARFDLLVAIVRYKTVIKKIREGICTRYLAALPEGSSLEVVLQKGSLGVSEAQASRPLVMIGPGTGIAPIRSLIWERLQWAQKTQTLSQNLSEASTVEEPTVGQMALFSGCRKKNADYFYQEEWIRLQKYLPLEVFTAFSREQKHKVYVQDLIKEQSELIYRLLHESQGIVYICGSSGKMPKAVRNALTEAFVQCGNMHQGDAEAYLQTMEKEGRYKQETW